MRGLPYYKAYPRDFLEGTIGMPLELKGAYRVVLDLIYMNSGKLPDDERYISGMLGCTVKKWNLIRGQLIGTNKIIVNGDYLTNERAMIELGKASEIILRLRQNGAKGGAKKAEISTKLSQNSEEISTKLSQNSEENEANINKNNILAVANANITRVITDTDTDIDISSLRSDISLAHFHENEREFETQKLDFESEDLWGEATSSLEDWQGELNEVQVSPSRANQASDWQASDWQASDWQGGASPQEPATAGHVGDFGGEWASPQEPAGETGFETSSSVDSQKSHINDRERGGNIGDGRLHQTDQEGALTVKYEANRAYPDLIEGEEFKLSSPQEPKPAVRTARKTASKATAKASSKAVLTAQLEEEFNNIFWPKVMKKVARAGALKSWGRARSKASCEQIIAGLERYQNTLKAKDTPLQFWAYPATFLNGERWTDEEPQQATTQQEKRHEQSYRNANTTQKKSLSEEVADLWFDISGDNDQVIEGEVIEHVSDDLSPWERFDFSGAREFETGDYPRGGFARISARPQAH